MACLTCMLIFRSKARCCPNVFHWEEVTVCTYIITLASRFSKYASRVLSMQEAPVEAGDPKKKPADPKKGAAAGTPGGLDGVFVINPPFLDLKIDETQVGDSI